MKPLDVLSVTGRALFFRFLLDRHIILDSERGEICLMPLNSMTPSQMRKKRLRHRVGSMRHSTVICCRSGWICCPMPVWMIVARLTSDCTAGWVPTRNKRCFFISRPFSVVGSPWATRFQRRLPIDWNDFNFAHIPIGVLSQVYETFSHQWDGKHAEKTSVYYTPKNIAQCLVEEAFGGLKTPADCACA